MENMDNIATEMQRGLILYTDGGARPNPGYGGFGLHGYLYRDEPPKKGTGNQQHVLTDTGYLLKKESELVSHKEITVEKYYDGYGSFAELVANNFTELVAAYEALKIAIGLSISIIKVYADSQYVIGCMHKLDKFKQENWMIDAYQKRPNAELLEKLYYLKEELKAKNIEIYFQYVEAHANIFGNETADQLATIGVMSSKNGIIVKEITEHQPDGYWKYEADRHPMLHHSKMYFNTLPEFVKRGEYLVGAHGKEDDLAGKATGNAAVGIVILDQPDEVLEHLRNLQIEMAQGQDLIMHARLDEIYNSLTHGQLTAFGKSAMIHKNPDRLDLQSIRKEPITREHTPARLIFRVIQSMEETALRFHQYLNKHPDLCITDITELFYDTEEKTDKKGVISKITTLKKDLAVGQAAVRVDMNYVTAKAVTLKTLVILSLGLDMPTRNSMKRLEDNHPIVHLISWRSGPETVRYATVILADKDKGIWHAAYSNLKVVPEN